MSVASSGFVPRAFGKHRQLDPNGKGRQEKKKIFHRVSVATGMKDLQARKVAAIVYESCLSWHTVYACNLKVEHHSLATVPLYIQQQVQGTHLLFAVITVLRRN